MQQISDSLPWPRVAAVFGAGGGIGRALCAQLSAEGCEVWAGSRSGAVAGLAGARQFACDLEDEGAIASAAVKMRDLPPDLVIVATGVLTLPDGTGPERSYKAIDGAAMEQVFRLNTIGPALVAKHVLPMFRRDQRTMFAALSARVGSIGDNRIGGWHSYRASKAALNMLLKNFAIELGRSHPQAVVAGLHPGTVDTGLSAPFQRGLPAGQLTSTAASAAHLLRVCRGLSPADSGGVFSWRGERVEP